ncbi:hypothetical protein SeMB42_g00398 [Synchytrium endobioticum]|uniref:EF-hand domain-containing protein n=1 Tax=Synchytrium endobioticum TaxID=286115 RepID=A0A507D7Z5_9FUNG|nr:hypothetical protein SeLEV6574_g02550 [Synchytrium endobioticum]TPX54185.1 hypothetical protein SeMB42_g00398 [Synchytrium endobioticum]
MAKGKKGGKKDKGDKADALPPAPVKTGIDKLTPEQKKSLEARILRAFKTFDQQNNNTCDENEVPSMLRSLGLCPAQQDLALWIKDMVSDEPASFVTFEKFATVALKILADPPPRDDEETLYRAFVTLDGSQRGYLTPDELRIHLCGRGERFAEEEMDEMLAACVDADGKVYYEDFVRILAQS